MSHEPFPLTISKEESDKNARVSFHSSQNNKAERKSHTKGHDGCKYCHGSGEVKRENVPQELWSKLTRPIETTNCPDCYGIGFEPNRKTCKKCNRTGKIPVTYECPCCTEKEENKEADIYAIKDESEHSK